MRLLVVLSVLALVSAAAAEDAAAPAPAPAVVAQQNPHWRHVTIANNIAEVELSTYRGSLARMRLLDQHPVALPKWRSPDRQQVDTKQPLPVLDAFNPPPAPDMHCFVSGMELPGDPSREGPWTVQRVTGNEAEFALDYGGLSYVLAYRMDAAKPQVHVALSVRNGRGDAVALTPMLRALNGLHQDDPIAETGYEKAVVHAGGEKGKIDWFSLPAAGATIHAPEGLAALDYAGLKSRFFAAWWAPAGVAMGEGGAAPVATAHSVDVTWTGFTPTGPAGLSHQAMLNVTYGVPPQGGGVMLPFSLRPGGTLNLEWSLAVACMTKDELAKLAPAERRLEYTDAYYSFFKSLANIMTWLLAAIASLVKLYGVAVILLTFLVKALLHRFTHKQYESMMKMQKLTPELKYLQEQYKNDRQKMAMKQMELYKKHGVNPLGGCLPVLIQIPIFIALYQSFCHSAEMRGQSFLWIRDLTLPDQVWYLGFGLPWGTLATINVLPLIYIAVTVWMSMLQKPPTGGDPQQEQMFKMMRWLPVVFGVIFYNMPAGLVLYFTVQAVLSTLEIKLVKRRLGMA